MIRNENLHQYLATVATALSGPIMGDLQSTPAKELAGAMLILLDRIQADLSSGDAIAATAQPEWARLKALTAKVVGTELPASRKQLTSTADWHALDEEIATVQQALGDDATFGRLVQQLKNGQPEAREWMRGMSALLATISRDFESHLWPAASAPGAQAMPAGIDRNADLKQRLSAYLAQRFPTLPPNPIERFAIVSGGNSKLSALLTLADNDVLPRQLALRMDIPNTSTPMRLDTEYPVMQRIFALGLPVPEPILFEPDPAWLGDAFVLMTQITEAKMAGSPFVEDRNHFGAHTAPEFGREAAGFLAVLHSKTLEPATAEAQVMRERDALLAELAADWRPLKKSSFSLASDLAIAWLQAHPLPTGRPSCLVHGDYVQHNILTRDGHIAAVLDWELAMAGDPAADLAQCKMMLIGGTISWDDFVKSYLAAGGIPAAVDPHAIAWYAVLLYLKHSVYQGKMRNGFEASGTRSDFKLALISGFFVDRLALYQAEALRDAVAAIG